MMRIKIILNRDECVALNEIIIATQNVIANILQEPGKQPNEIITRKSDCIEAINLQQKIALLLLKMWPRKTGGGYKDKAILISFQQGVMLVRYQNEVENIFSQSDYTHNTLSRISNQIWKQIL